MTTRFHHALEIYFNLESPNSQYFNVKTCEHKTLQRTTRGTNAQIYVYILIKIRNWT